MRDLPITDIPPAEVKVPKALDDQEFVSDCSNGPSPTVGLQDTLRQRSPVQTRVTLSRKTDGQGTRRQHTSRPPSRRA